MPSVAEFLAQYHGGDRSHVVFVQHLPLDELVHDIRKIFFRRDAVDVSKRPIWIWRTEALKPSRSASPSNWLTRLFMDLDSSYERRAAQPRSVRRPPGRNYTISGRSPPALSRRRRPYRPKYRVGPHGSELPKTAVLVLAWAAALAGRLARRLCRAG